MAKLRLHRRTSLSAGQLLLAGAFVELVFGGFFSAATSNFVFTCYATGVFIGLFGLVLLLISPFLPKCHEKDYRGMEKLLSHEKLHYGNYAQGNWRTALNEMEKEDKDKQKRETDHQ